jgi:hypothetical protein
MWTTHVSVTIRDLKGQIERKLTLAQDRVTRLLWQIWRKKAKATRSFRTGEYYRSIVVDPRAYLSAGVKSRYVGAGANHSAIVEQVLQPVPGYERFSALRRAPAALAIKDAEPGIIKILVETGRDIAGV